MQTRDFLGRLDNARIVAAIRDAEAGTRAEIRVHVTDKAVTDAEQAAERQFETLGMTATAERNGVLIFVAPQSQAFAVVGDKGIHEKSGGQEFWAHVAAAMQEDFRAGRFTDGIVKGVAEAGEALARHFPRETHKTDVNELPDEVSRD
jgi:uncharacterized membrane protein